MNLLHIGRSWAVPLWLAALFLTGLMLPDSASAAVRYTVTGLCDLPGDDYAHAYGLNQTGQVVGNYGIADEMGTSAFLYDGVLHDIGGLEQLEGYPDTTAYAVNDQGKAVGYSRISYVDFHAFFYDGAMHDLGAGIAYDVNNLNQIAGSSDVFDLGYAFLYDGTMHDLGALPGGRYSAARGINDKSQVVGVSETTDGFGHAFLYDKKMYDLGTLGGTSSFANAINEKGQAVGWALTSSGWGHAFLYDGFMRDLGTLGGSDSNARAVNDGGFVVGEAATKSGETHAFLYDGASILDLNDLIDPLDDSTLVGAFGINNSGQIIAVGTRSWGATTISQAFLLNPVPEPSSVTCLGFAAMSLCGFLAHARKRARH